MNKKIIGVVTATRAEYGILTPLLKRIIEDDGFELDLFVTGTHLSEKHGMTVSQIEKDGFEIDHRISILEDGNAPYDISVTMSNALRKFADVFRSEKPDMLIILGDRTEILGIAAAAMNEHIPIAHIHGGEVTEGAVDDCIRHSLTKMSYLHFASTEEYRHRIIQLGESPDRVFNVGALSTENILNVPLMDEQEIRTQIGIPKETPYAVVTFHPVTLENNTVIAQMNELCKAMDSRKDVFYVITASNADAGGNEINDIWAEYVKTRENAVMVDTLGMLRYLSAVKYAKFVLGNSSSGIIEAPVLGTLTVNIGDRQKGRISADTIINCNCKSSEIMAAIVEALGSNKTPSRIYGDGKTSLKICRILHYFLDNDRINLKKKFYDVDFKEKVSNV